MKAERRIRSEAVNGHFVVDFTKDDSPLLLNLTAPIRIVEYKIGNILYRVPRGANDPTPDDVVSVGGILHNLSSGELTIDDN